MMTLIALAIGVAFLFSAAVTLGYPSIPLWEARARFRISDGTSPRCDPCDCGDRPRPSLPARRHRPYAHRADDGTSCAQSRRYDFRAFTSATCVAEMPSSASP